MSPTVLELHFIFSPSFGGACSLIKYKDSVLEEINFFIKTTQRIYLARAESAQNGKVEMTVIENIKGEKKDKILVAADLVIKSEANDRTFRDHTDPLFWSSRYLGRIDDKGKCELKPTFSKGKIYLVFIDDRVFLKKAEQIDVFTDRWYEYVKNSLAKGRL